MATAARIARYSVGRAFAARSLSRRSYGDVPAGGRSSGAAKTQGNKASLAAWLFGGSPLLAESVAGLGFDAVVVDLQHGIGDRVAMFHAIAASSTANTQIFCRVPKNCDAEIALALDAGAHGLICPLVNSGEEATSFVAAAHFPPDGRRSYGPHRTAWSSAGALTPGDWTRAQNAQVATYAMVETASALDALDDILAVPRLTGVFIGPNDLGMALGHDPASAPTGKVLETIEMICGRAHAAGKKAGIFCADAETCRRMTEIGFDFVTVGGDFIWLRGAAAAALQRARE